MYLEKPKFKPYGVTVCKILWTTANENGYMIQPVLKAIFRQTLVY